MVENIANSEEGIENSPKISINFLRKNVGNQRGAKNIHSHMSSDFG